MWETFATRVGDAEQPLQCLLLTLQGEGKTGDTIESQNQKMPAGLAYDRHEK